jgi:hypothetical protein
VGLAHRVWAACRELGGAQRAQARATPPVGVRSLAADLHKLVPDKRVVLGHVDEVCGGAGLRNAGADRLPAVQGRCVPFAPEIAPTLSGQLSTTLDVAMAAP